MEWRDVADRAGERKLTCSITRSSVPALISQFPVTRSTNMRTVANQLPSGYTIRMADTGAQKVQWQLRYSDLTDGERSSIESLFEALARPIEHVHFLRSHRQSIDVERGLDANGVDGRSAYCRLAVECRTRWEAATRCN